MKDDQSISWNFIKNFKLLFEYRKNKYLKKERETTPYAIYPKVKLLGKTYHSRILNADRFSLFLDLVREYIRHTEQEDELDYTLGFDATVTVQNYAYLKEKLQFQEMYALHNADNTHRIGDNEETYFVPYCITFYDKFLPQNYFITYLPYYQKIEILTHDLPEFTDKTPFKQQVKEQIQALKTVEDDRIIQKIEQSFDGFYQFIEEAVIEYREVIERQQTKKRAKLFAETDVLQRAKALYNLLKIPQHEQEIIYQSIEDEDDILNLGMLDADYILWDDIHWGEINALFNREFFKHYGVEKVFEKSKNYPDEIGVHHSYFILEIGREILKYGKTLVNLKNSVYNTDKYVIIDSFDRHKMLEIVEGLKKNDEIEGVVFYDEIEQLYPLPEDDFFEQIEYVFKPQKNRTVANVRSDLITANEYLLGDCVLDAIDATMPIFTDIIVECEFVDKAYKITEKIALTLPKNGFNFVNLCFLLEQKIAQQTDFPNDVWHTQSFALGYNNQPIFILKLSSKNNEKTLWFEGYKELITLLVQDKNQQKLTDKVEKLCNCETDKYDILYGIKSFAEDENIPFLIHLDWKSPIEELDDYLGEVLKNSYPRVKVKLPTAKDFDEDNAVGTEGVFSYYDKALRKVGLQFGFFDTDSDDYLIVVHKTTDQEKVNNIFKKMGWGYFEENGE